MTNHWTLTLIATATAAATVGLAVPAHADSYFDFRSPSANIGCSMMGSDAGPGSVICKLRDRTWAAPAKADGDCEYPGPDLRLLQGDAPCAGVTASQIFMQPYYDRLPTLGYGQTHTIGAITCGSDPAGVTCTDTSTGHFFRVSRESYQLG